MRRFLTILSCSTLLLAGCQHITEYKDETARRTALPVFMIPRTVPADPFTLQAYERVHKKHDTAVLYIEGDTMPLNGFSKLNLAASPSDPIALRMAAQDGRPNVIYLARPCQYESRYMGKESCPSVFTGADKFSQTVIDAYGHALDNIKAYNNINNFEIVGYDGGAAIATILAAERSDIVSLRTVAGEMNTKQPVDKKGAPVIEGLNPADYANKLTNMPQHHFVGTLDKVAPRAIYSNYLQALGPSSCVSLTMVDKADHKSGWVEQWKSLVALPVTCAPEPKPVSFDPTTLDGDKGHRGKYDKR